MTSVALRGSGLPQSHKNRARPEGVVRACGIEMILIERLDRYDLLRDDGHGVHNRHMSLP